jgi:hypothetical protein
LFIYFEHVIFRQVIRIKEEEMKGQVIDFLKRTDSGIISGSDGQRYEFSGDEWKDDAPPTKGCLVDFETEGKNALSIYRTIPAESPGKSGTDAVTNTSILAIIALVAGIMGIFLFGSLVGIVCGHIARYQIRNSNGTLTGDGMALAGLVLGYIGLVLGIIGFFGVAVLMEMDV